jgi:hypothetical protein
VFGQIFNALRGFRYESFQTAKKDTQVRPSAFSRLVVVSINSPVLFVVFVDLVCSFRLILFAPSFRMLIRLTLALVGTCNSLVRAPSMSVARSVSQ